MPRQLSTPDGRPRMLGAIHPNAGIEAEYRKKLLRLIESMHKSLAYWLLVQYRQTPPVTSEMEPRPPRKRTAAAQEPEMWWRPSFVVYDQPAKDLQAEMRSLGRRWQSRFDELAPQLAAWFATAVKDRSDGALKAMLERAGMTVRFTTTAGMRDVLNATMAQQVGLIKSIAQQHLAEVQGMVMRSVMAGHDVGALARDLEERLGVTKRRAAFIARHQNNMAAATLQRVRQVELGIQQAIWIHSGAGKHPRPTHVKAGRDRQVYDTRIGWFDPHEQRNIFPGELPNCRCVSRAVVPGLE